ncbi:MAG: TIGR04086 family membrane protein [Clostridia bacterium]|nr:TIGR04086 family membrane protein [Clostridia bacterium]
MDSFRRSMRRNVRRGRGKGALGAVLKGVLVGASLTVIGVAIFALILNWWDASDRAITAINQVVKFVSILAGVVSAQGREAQGSVLRGICVGFLYMALGIICYCLLMGQQPAFSGYLADLGMGIASGGLFGMILSPWGKA